MSIQQNNPNNEQFWYSLPFKTMFECFQCVTKKCFWFITFQNALIVNTRYDQLSTLWNVGWMAADYKHHFLWKAKSMFWQSTFSYHNEAIYNRFHVKDETIRHQFLGFLKVSQILKTRYLWTLKCKNQAFKQTWKKSLFKHKTFQLHKKFCL